MNNGNCPWAQAQLKSSTEPHLRLITKLCSLVSIGMVGFRSSRASVETLTHKSRVAVIIVIEGKIGVETRDPEYGELR